MGDDADIWWRSWEVGFDPNDAVDRTVMATRKDVFPAVRPGPLVRLTPGSGSASTTAAIRGCHRRICR